MLSGPPFPGLRQIKASPYPSSGQKYFMSARAEPSHGSGTGQNHMDGTTTAKEAVLAEHGYETGRLTLREVHVLEMVGYTDPRPGSQRVPPPIPKFLSPQNTKNFIKIISLKTKHHLTNRIQQTTSKTLNIPPIINLQAPHTLLKLTPNLKHNNPLPFIYTRQPTII